MARVGVGGERGEKMVPRALALSVQRTHAYCMYWLPGSPGSLLYSAMYGKVQLRGCEVVGTSVSTVVAVIKWSMLNCVKIIRRSVIVVRESFKIALCVLMRVGVRAIRLYRPVR